MKSSLGGSTGAWEGGTGNGERVEYEKQLLSSSNGDGSSSSRVQVSGVGIEDGAVAGEDAESPNAHGLRAPIKSLSFKLKAIELAKRPGGQGKDGTVGACAAAEALNVRETTLRMWMRREAEIRQDAKKAGINLNEINNEVVPNPTIKLKTRNSLPARTSLLTQFEEPLRQWVVLQVEISPKNMVPYEHVINHARSLDPAFMPEIPATSTLAEKSAFKRRARDWFQRFCKRHHIVMTRYGRSRGGGDRQSHLFDNAFKLRAIELARDVVDGGKGPSGTRGKEEAGRMMGVTANAIWKWQKKEQQLRELAHAAAAPIVPSVYAPLGNVISSSDQNTTHHVIPTHANQFQNHPYMPVDSAALPGSAVHGVGDLHPIGMSSSYPSNIATDR